MKAIRILICTLALLTLLAQCALCTQVWTEQRISTSTVGTRGNPVVYGDRVYWGDERSGQAQVYVWDRSGGERPLIAQSHAVYLMAAYGDAVTYAVDAGGQYDLYMWDPRAGEQTVCAAPGDQMWANMYGNTVVWEDRRTGTSQVHIWDAVEGDRAIAPTGYTQANPRIWGDTVVWEEWRTDHYSTYMWNQRDGTKLIGYGKNAPAIYGDKVVMFAPYSDPYAYNSYLYQYSISTGTTSVLSSTVFGRSATGTGIWGDTVTWYNNDGSSSSNVMAWDPVHGVTRVNQSHSGSAWTPSVYGTTVAWVGMSAGNNPTDIYLSTLVPEPGNMVSLAFGLVYLASEMRRRRAK